MGEIGKAPANKYFDTAINSDKITDMILKSIREFFEEIKEFSDHPLKWQKSAIFLATLSMYYSSAYTFYDSHSVDSFAMLLISAFITGAILYRQSVLGRELHLSAMEEIEVLRHVSGRYFAVSLLVGMLLYMLMCCILLCLCILFGLNVLTPLFMLWAGSVLFVGISILKAESYLSELY